MELERDHDSVNLEWENLALYNNDNGKVPIQQFAPLSSNEFPQQHTMMHHHYTQSSSSYDHDDLVSMHNTRVSEPMIGLHLGTHKQYGHTFTPISTKTPTPTPTKRSRASYHNMQNPCCQVEGCNLDLKSAKDYHRRHRICESHSKSPRVIVAGKERRFCQQCSRFHDLSEFDDKKRSCRRRLSDHNARRRRVQPESIQLTSTGLSSALYADQRQQNVLLSGLPISLSNSTTWDQHRHSLIRPPKPRGLNGALNFSSDHDIHNLHMDSDKFHVSNHRVLDQCLQVASANPSMAPDMLNAHSLLSSNGWSLNEGESTTMEGLVHGNYNQVMRHSESETHHLSLFHQRPPPAVSLIDSVNMQDEEASSQQQEYRLFKSPYDSDAFYSSQRYL